ncbi:hypothetical protein CR513_56379, partial [Mucuna pruriens]
MVENFGLDYSTKEWVYHSTGEGDGDFVYLYETMIRDLSVIVPFDKYEADVLQILGVAPTQLHPNGWAAMQAFRVVCHCLRIKPAASLFLYHYTTCIDVKASWVSLSPLSKTNLFNTYLAFYKGFKNHLVKVRALGGTFFAEDKKPMPLYW